MSVARFIGLMALIASAACSGHRRPNANSLPVFTGNGCGSTRLRNQFAGGWQEARTAKFTFCVPPEFLPKDDGQFWDSRYTRFAWANDPRVVPGHTSSLAAVVSSGREISGAAEPSNDPRFPENIDGEPAKVTVLKVDENYYVRVTFRSAESGMAFFGKSSRTAGIDVLLAVLRSIRFAR